MTATPDTATIADRDEIRTVLSRYVRAIRTADVDAMDEVFTADSVIDYSAIGGPKAPWVEVKQWLAGAIAVDLFLLHVGDVYADFAPGGDRADVETTWHGVFRASPTDEPLLIYGTYGDRFVRTERGWRIESRVDRPAVQLTVPVVER